MRDKKSRKRLCAEVLVGIIVELVVVFLVVTGVTMWSFSQEFVHARVIGGVAAAVFVLLVDYPLEYSSAYRKLWEVEHNYEELGKTAKALDDKLRMADRFIKEFVSLRGVLDRLHVLQDDYRGRVTHGDIAIRGLAATEHNSVGKYDEVMQIVRKARDEVSGGEYALREACTLAAKHGFTPRPPEYYLGLPMPGVEGRNEPPGQ